MLRDLLIKDRSYRGYNENRTVSKEELTELVELTRYCPSTVNRQPLRYYLACELEIVAKIQKNTIWAKALKDITLPHPGKCPTAFIVIVQDTRLDENTKRFLRDVGIVSQTILLGAVEKGLGGCMIGSFNAGGITEALELPEYLVPMLVLAIGEPVEEVVITEPKEDGSIGYYRDENDTHYVPKRPVEDLIIN